MTNQTLVDKVSETRGAVLHFRPSSAVMPTLPVRRREIRSEDVGRVVDLLANGMGNQDRSHWEVALARLAAHRTPPGYPKYGYLLESGGTPVGVTLMIYSTLITDGQPRVRCNMSSWLVLPEFAAYASQLASWIFRQKEVTFFNVTPHPRTYPMLEARGYTRYCNGIFIAVPALSAPLRGARVRAAAPDLSPGDDLSDFERQLLLDHRSYGCVSLTCTYEQRRYPFVFQAPRKYGRMLSSYLLYCRNLDDFARVSGPLGRFLALRGIFLVLADANGPISGLVGRYHDDSPKYFRGPNPPRLGDLAYSERALFGV